MGFTYHLLTDENLPLLFSKGRRKSHPSVAVLGALFAKYGIYYRLENKKQLIA